MSDIATFLNSLSPFNVDEFEVGKYYLLSDLTVRLFQESTTSKVARLVGDKVKVTRREIKKVWSPPLDEDKNEHYVIAALVDGNYSQYSHDQILDAYRLFLAMEILKRERTLLSAAGYFKISDVGTIAHQPDIPTNTAEQAVQDIPPNVPQNGLQWAIQVVANEFARHPTDRSQYRFTHTALIKVLRRLMSPDGEYLKTNPEDVEKIIPKNEDLENHSAMLRNWKINYLGKGCE